MARGKVEDAAVVLRPLSARVVGSALWSSALAVVPPFAALYALAWGTDGWRMILAVNIVVAGLLYLGISRVRQARIVLRQDSVLEIGYFGRTVVTPVEAIVKILVVEVYSGRSLDASTTAFFLDSAGRTRVRIRGQFWGEAALDTAVAAYDIPVERLPEPIARADLRQRFRRNLYPYERYPSVTYTLGGVLLVVVSAPLISVLNSAV